MEDAQRSQQVQWENNNGSTSTNAVNSRKITSVIQCWVCLMNSKKTGSQQSLKVFENRNDKTLGRNDRNEKYDKWYKNAIEGLSSRKPLKINRRWKKSLKGNEQTAYSRTQGPSKNRPK